LIHDSLLFLNAFDEDDVDLVVLIICDATLVEEQVARIELLVLPEQVTWAEAALKDTSELCIAHGIFEDGDYMSFID